MGLGIQASLVCDKDLTTTVHLDKVDSLPPDGWMIVQGYANISSGIQAPILAYFCPVCIVQYGTLDLVKRAADIAPDLTKAPE